MLFAVSHLDRAAGRTDQLLRVELLTLSSLVHGLGTVFSTPKVRFSALVANEVSIDGHGIFFFIFVIG